MRFDDEGLVLPIETPGIERQDVLVLRKPPARFHDQKADVPATGIDERSSQRSQRSTIGADNGDRRKRVFCSAEMAGVDVTEMRAVRVHVSRFFNPCASAGRHKMRKTWTNAKGAR